MTGTTSQSLPRDFVGYGPHPPHPEWPNGARVAIVFNLNFEGGGESNVLDGDSTSEPMLNDIGFPAYEGCRSPLAESVFEYGSRRGVWRVLDAFAAHDLKISVLGVARALERCPDATRAFVAAGHELVSHGYRWIDYHLVPEGEERCHIARASDILTDLIGAGPKGWMTGRPGPNTRRLLVEHGGYLYDRDTLNDELPYWQRVGGTDHLVIPYSYETNDNRFNENSGFSTSGDFFRYHRDCFDTLYREGEKQPGLMSVGLHDRLIGRPGRIDGLRRFLDHISGFPDVWICRSIDIARHWRARFPAEAMVPGE